MRKVELNLKENYQYKIIKKLVETNGNKIPQPGHQRHQLHMQRAGWIDVFYIVGRRKHVIATFCTIGRREHIIFISYDENNMFSEFSKIMSPLCNLL